MYTIYRNLSLIPGRVCAPSLALRDKDRQYLLIVDWLGFERTSIQVEPADRYAGKSAYTLRRLLKVAVDGMFFQSTVLLRWVVYSGFVVAGIGVALAAYTFAVFIAGRHVPDWTALPMMVLFLTGFIIVSGGGTRLYVRQILDQVQR